MVAIRKLNCFAQELPFGWLAIITSFELQRDDKISCANVRCTQFYCCCVFYFLCLFKGALSLQFQSIDWRTTFKIDRNQQINEKVWRFGSGAPVYTNTQIQFVSLFVRHYANTLSNEYIFNWLNLQIGAFDVWPNKSEKDLKETQGECVWCKTQRVQQQ